MYISMHKWCTSVLKFISLFIGRWKQGLPRTASHRGETATANDPPESTSLGEFSISDQADFQGQAEDMTVGIDPLAASDQPEGYNIVSVPGKMCIYTYVTVLCGTVHDNNYGASL